MQVIVIATVTKYYSYNQHV